VTLLARVAAELERAGIATAVCGAGALAVHGIARSTYDIDLLTTDPSTLRDATWRTLAGTQVHVEIRRGDDDDPLLGVVRVKQDKERPVDVIVGRHAWQTAVVDAASPSRVLGAPVRVVDVPSLILLKLYAGGPQDLWDIEQLLALAGDDVVRAVDAVIGQLPPSSRALWEPFRSRGSR
jgi:nucleotidyltransferase AbiEii toxin of type IV toxin-antitoxin system